MRAHWIFSRIAVGMLALAAVAAQDAAPRRDAKKGDFARFPLGVLGGTAGKFRLYGGTRAKTWDENTVDYRHYRARRDIGGLIHKPDQARRIILTNVPA